MTPDSSPAAICPAPDQPTAPCPNTRRTTLLRGLTLGAAALAGVAGPQARAWAQPAEGREYRAVTPAAPTDAPAGKIEVVEFFWYGCPHCHSLEPALKEWLRKLPPDVVFRKAHVPWQVQAHQQLFFALESLGLADTHNDKVFTAIHTDRNRLDKPEAMADLLARHGVDRKQFNDAFASFGVRTRAQRATQLAAAYKVESVPTFGVGGRYLTSPGMAGSNGASLQVLDMLIDRVRKGR
jgi:thiol:disulfide interchange protein DsbA